MYQNLGNNGIYIDLKNNNSVSIREGIEDFSMLGPILEINLL